MLTLDIDTGDVDRRLGALSKALGIGMQEVTYRVMAEYTEMVTTDATPPYYAKVGRKAVTRDINSLFVPMTNPFAEWIEDEDLDRDKRIKGTKFNLDGNLNRMIGWHQSHRTGRRGSVKFAPMRTGSIGHVHFDRRMYVPLSRLTAYRKEMVAHVGRLKKGWLPAMDHWSAKAKFGSVPELAWVRKVKARPEGTASGRIDALGNGDVRSTNSVPYADEAIPVRKINAIWRKEQDSITTQTEFAASRIIKREGLA